VATTTGDTTLSENQTETMTQHSLLMVCGISAQALGLIPEILKVPIQQKTVEHSPHTKILEFFLAILAGLNRLQELTTAAEPIVENLAVAQAWQQSGWAHHSGISRTLKALTQEEGEQIAQVLNRLEQPISDLEVMLALAAQGEVISDGDLTPRQVPDTSIDYPDAAFGHTQGAGWFGISISPSDFPISDLQKIADFQCIAPWRRCFQHSDGELGPGGRRSYGVAPFETDRLTPEMD